MKQSRFNNALRSIAILLLGIQACTILPPRQDPSKFFILTAASDSAPAPASGRPVSLGIGPIKFPGYLKRPEMVTRIDADQLQLSAENRWAEPLDSNFQRVLAQDLSQMLGTERIVLFPWYGNPQIDYQVEVQVHRFDTDQQGRSQLDANWIIRDGHNGTVLFATESSASTDSAGKNADHSATLSRDVEKFSRQIAEQIARLNETRASLNSGASLQSGQSANRSAAE